MFHWIYFFAERQSGGTAPLENPSAETEQQMSGCSPTACWLLFILLSYAGFQSVEGGEQSFLLGSHRKTENVSCGQQIQTISHELPDVQILNNSEGISQTPSLIGGRHIRECGECGLFYLGQDAVPHNSDGVGSVFGPPFSIVGSLNQVSGNLDLGLQSVEESPPIGRANFFL